MRQSWVALAVAIFLYGAGAQAQETLKPYRSVITTEATSSRGVFGVHRLKEKLYFEIPKQQLNREFLLVTQVARTRLGAGYGGDPLDQRVVRWELRDQKVLLRNIAYDIVSDPNAAISRAVRAANNDAILMSFNVEALGPGGSPVIEVSKLYTTDVLEFSPKQFLKAKYFDPTRSFLENARAFPINVEVESTLTYSNPSDGARDAGPATSSVVVHYSMVQLPEKPMKPRLYDPRVGFFTVAQTDYSRPEQRVASRRFITRWRLEKRNPQEPISEPVKPIVFYIDPATPPQWLPYIKKGVEQWQSAFEEAGFKNAIIAREAPKDDSAFSMEDARYSVIRWLPSPVENAYGPHISDPRSGEILQADIHVYHNISSLIRSWYFVQVSPLDFRARRLPFPDELLGTLIEFVVAHEVGHSLGFPHNFKASSTYPARQLRNRDWVHRMGHCPSIMDYSRFNYVAQPEDHIDVADLVPRVGPYDRFAARWGYKPIPGVASPDEEKPTLDAWSREQDRVPWYRFSTPGMFNIDPGDESEAVGDEDAIYATTEGLKNLHRVAQRLILATEQSGEDWSDLADMYERLLTQWTLEMGHVTALVGGQPSRQKNGDQQGVLYSSVPRARQQAAVRFLLANAFHAPAFLLDKQVLRRIEASGSLARLQRYQHYIMRNLLQPARLSRLLEQAAVGPRSGYLADSLLNDVRQGLFSELQGAGAVTVDASRRGVQRMYVETLTSLLDTEAGSDTRGLALTELKSVQTEVKKALPRVSDRTVRSHLLSLSDQIGRAFQPREAGSPRGLQAPLPAPVQGCWEEWRVP